MYKSIIFDIGGVLVDFDPKAYLVDRLCNAEMEEKVYDLTFGSEEWQLLDAGKLSRYDGNQRMLERARAEGCAFEVQGVLDDWMHILRPRLRMLELVRRLKNHGYCVYYLSNIPQDVLELLTERGVLTQFDGGVASCEVQVNKPDPRIYKALLKKYQLKASECIFIDDRLENVQAAFALGFAGIQMKDSVGTLILVALAVVRGLHLLGGAVALLRHLDLRQITFAAVHIVAARADITGHADVFHAYHLFVHRLPRGQRVYTWVLPSSQICAQLTAGSLHIVIRGFVADEAFLAEQLCAVILCALCPVAHPLAIAPAVGAEQCDLFAVQRAFQCSKHGLELTLFQLLCTHSRAAKGHHIKLCQLCGGHLGAGHDGAVGTCALGDAVCHGLGVAGGAPEYDCYFAHKTLPLSLRS